MSLRYRIPLPGPFYYSGRVGPKHWLPRSSNTGNGEIIGQVVVGVSGSSVELTPSCLHSPGWSDAVEEAWSWFCGRIREIPDSVAV